ncbi:MAG: LysM peptidoglycan-binding domain-containing protein [Treponema sp.]|nr:LysM peptidoglycan-binding domain-containing protein [Treponema sp.]
MKKIFSVLVVIGLCVNIFAASYTNNEYQRLARDYTKRAEIAFDEGEYDLAVEYTLKAEKNAELSQAYIQMMLAKADAEKQLKLAGNQLERAQSIRGDVNYPMAFTAGKTAYERGLQEYEKEEYISASAFALEALEAFAGIREITPLPMFYTVRPWADTRDCYWNISGRSYVYNNPTLWENLYQANKSKMRNPNNPDLIYPGMKMTIPSISGEYREGEYSSKKQYEPFNPSR